MGKLYKPILNECSPTLAYCVDAKNTEYRCICTKHCTYVSLCYDVEVYVKIEA